MSDREAEKLATPTERLIATVARLRGEGGCPWDREQTLHSLRQYAVEEAYELLDAIESEDARRHMDELGDVLLQVVLQAQIRSEEKSFSFDDVAAGLVDKLIRRHPHVFGDVTVSGPDEVLGNWEKIKAKEREGTSASLLDGVPRHLPALQKAQRIQSRASRVGFDWARVEDAFSKVEEELQELREAMAADDHGSIREEIGDLLFAVVNLCRFQDVVAEEALQATTRKFARRFRHVEQGVRAEGGTMPGATLEQMDAHWEAAKKAE